MAIRTERGFSATERPLRKSSDFAALKVLPYAPWIFAVFFLVLAAFTVFVPSVNHFFSNKTTPLLLVVVMSCVAVGFLTLDVRRVLESVAAYAHSVRSVVEDGRRLEEGIPAQPGMEGLAESINRLLSHVLERYHSSLDLLGSNRVLARELSRLFRLLDSLNDGILAVDTAGRVIFANQVCGAFLNVTPEEARGKLAKECIQDPDVRRMVIEQGTEGSLHSVRTLEFKGEASGGGSNIAVSLGHGVQEGDTTVGQILLFRDIGYIKKVEKQQGEFIDSVARELQAPLTTIRTQIEDLMARTPETMENEQRDKKYSQIYEECDRLSHLIDSLLNMSLMESGAATLEIAPTRLKHLLEECVELSRPQSVKKNIELVTDIPDRLPALNVDKRLFTIAIMNILGNALKFTPAGGTVNVSTSSNEDELSITILDSGAGISEEHLPRIFDKFYRGDTETEGEPAGSGIGLATALQIVRLHGGDIRVSSKVSEGSQFSISLPRSIIDTSSGE